MSFASKIRAPVTGALAVGAAALVSALPAQAGHFGDDGGFVKKVVIVKKPAVHAGYGFHGYGYPPRTTVIVKKHFGGPGYGSYGPGYGFYGPRPVGFYGHSRFDDDF